jgi:glycosyltransferase involved in cell wall biosynthesis
MGHEVHIAHLETADVPPELLASGVTLHALPCRGHHDPMLLLRLLRIIRRVRPDVVQTWILQMDVFGGLAATLSGVPWVLREPASALAWAPNLKTRLRHAVAGTAAAVVANSAGGLRYWAQHPRPVRRVQIANAVPIHAIAAAECARPRDFDLPEDAPVVMFAGRLDEGKNVSVLVKALARVADRRPVVGVIFGRGAERPALEKLIADSGRGDRIFLRDPLPSIFGALKAASLFVTVSRHEGRPNVVLEAMAAGCPLVVSDIPGHREILDESSAAIVSDYDDPEAVADAIADLLANRELAASQAKAAQERVACFDLDQVASAYLDLYRDIVAADPRPAILAGEAARRPE